MTDEQLLVEALQNGEESAFRRLVDAQQERVLNTCLGFVPNRQDAEDLTQEVFVVIFRSIGKFRQECSLATWVYRIAVSQSLDFLRRQRRKKRLAFFQTLAGLDDAKTQAPASAFDHPGVRLEQQDDARALFEQLARLSDNQRAAFVLHKVEGLSQREIGDVLGLNIPAVESLLHRAKKNLQTALYNYYKTHH